MPEHLTLGIFVEYESSHAKRIEGVATANTRFIGASLFGLVTSAPELLAGFCPLVM